MDMDQTVEATTETTDEFDTMDLSDLRSQISDMRATLEFMESRSMAGETVDKVRATFNRAINAESRLTVKEPVNSFAKLINSNMSRHEIKDLTQFDDATGKAAFSLTVTAHEQDGTVCLVVKARKVGDSEL